MRTNQGLLRLDIENALGRIFPVWAFAQLAQKRGVQDLFLRREFASILDNPANWEMGVGGLGQLQDAILGAMTHPSQ